MAFNVILLIFIITFCNVNCSYKIERQNEAINSSYLEEVLDAQECDRQIQVIRRNTMLLLQFADSGLRTPRGILTGNAVDLGNYYQCLGIDHQLEEMHIQGKYCSIGVPFNQSLELPGSLDMQLSHFNPSSLRLDNTTISMIEEYDIIRRQLLAMSGDFDGFDGDTRSTPGNPLAHIVFRLGVCVPKPCSTEQAITSLFFNISEIGFEYTDHYCRLPDDKPWVPADYVAISFFSMLGFLTVISTCYDIWCRFILKKDVKQINVLYRSFSVYTNGQILTTFNSGSGSMRCLDGIRTLAMTWVILGHSFATEPFIANPIDSSTWTHSAQALWLTTATMTVDTFFTLAGVLLVYTTVGKMTQKIFVRNLHWFYLNRFMRVTPMLAVAVIIQATYYNRMTDGPHWVTVAAHTDRCRTNWLMTLLHVQNFMDPTDMCVSHSWYVAIDFQLYIVSPIILYWVFSDKKRVAWSSLLGGLAVVLIVSTVYCFQMDLPAGVLVPSRVREMLEYFKHYYFNTLTRASPFFVGLVFGYLLHTYRKKKLHIPWFLAIFFWTCFTGVLAGIIYFKYRIKQFDWDNKLADNLMNSFMRPSYACAICWMIVACVHGYAGPVNWFLSLDIWRLPARLTFGMYLYHYPLMYTLNATMVAPIYFSVGRFLFKFLAYLVLSVMVSFIFTLLVDSPITVLYKLLMEKVKPKSTAVNKNKAVSENTLKKNSDNNNHIENTNTDVIPIKSKNELIPINNVSVTPSIQSGAADNGKDSEVIEIHNDFDNDTNIVRIDDTGIHMNSPSNPEAK